MEIALGACVVCSLLATLGARVFARARRAAATTDSLIGVYFLAMGLGAIPALLSNDPSLFARSAAPYAMAFGHATLSVGFGALAVFAWRCFGPDSGWRRALAGAMAGLLTGLLCAQGWIERFEPPGGAVVQATAIVRASTLVWVLSESVRYWLLMRRRARIGLAEPLVANRFLLWSLWMGAMLGTIGVAIFVRFFVPGFGPSMPFATRVLVAAPMMGLSVLAAVSLWLAFFPPRWYAGRFVSAAPDQPG